MFIKYPLGPSILPRLVHTLFQLSFTTDHNLTARTDRARVVTRPLFHLVFLVAVLSDLSFFWRLGWDKAANLRKCLGSGFPATECISAGGFWEIHRPLTATPCILGFVRAGMAQESLLVYEHPW